MSMVRTHPLLPLTDRKVKMGRSIRNAACFHLPPSGLSSVRLLPQPCPWPPEEEKPLRCQQPLEG